MKHFPKIAPAVLLPICICGVIGAAWMHNWHRGRQTVLALCEETKFHHSNETWASFTDDSRRFFRSPSALRDTILQKDFDELRQVVREIDSAHTQHEAEVRSLGPAATKDQINRLEMLFSTGINERLTIHQQVLWQEITLLRNWRPGLSAQQIREMSKSFDSQGLEVFTSTAIKALH